MSYVELYGSPDLHLEFMKLRAKTKEQQICIYNKKIIDQNSRVCCHGKYQVIY
jgi:hypothetical protein